MLQDNRKKVMFWSICQLNNWKFVVLDQYYRLLFSGILDDIEKVYITVLGGEDIDWLLSKHNKFVLDKRGKVNEYERTCLHSLLEYAQTNDADVLYIHTKGVSKPNNPNVQEWRRLMEYFLIDKYKECLDKLEDVVGCCLNDDGNNEKIGNESHKLHFSGNFWWAKTEYIRKLPLIRPDYEDLSINNRYWLTERWILYLYPDVKLYEIYRGQVNYYFNKPDRNYLKL